MARREVRILGDVHAFPRDVRARLVTTHLARAEDLDAILELQRANLERSLDASEAKADGFVTVVHTRAILEHMHRLAPSIVARVGEVVIGYALVMPQETQALLPILEPLFARIARGPFAGRRWYVMGQVAVAKAWRGAGVFDALYAAHRAHYRDRWDVVITEIALRNGRSLRAHERVGFRVVETYRDDVDAWAVVALELS